MVKLLKKGTVIGNFPNEMQVTGITISRSGSGILPASKLRKTCRYSRKCYTCWAGIVDFGQSGNCVGYNHRVRIPKQLLWKKNSSFKFKRPSKSDLFFSKFGNGFNANAAALASLHFLLFILNFTIRNDFTKSRETCR